MRVFDVHVHVQPWSMLKPDVLPLIDDTSHAGAREVLSTPDALLRHLDANDVERACCINYVSPDVMGFTLGASGHQLAQSTRPAYVGGSMVGVASPVMPMLNPMSVNERAIAASTNAP